MDKGFPICEVLPRNLTYTSHDITHFEVWMLGLCEVSWQHLTRLQPFVYARFRGVMLGCEVSFDLSLFYIKPQLPIKMPEICIVVLYLCSTSNHNSVPVAASWSRLSYISVLHQTTTEAGSVNLMSSCLISLFYIKPQLAEKHCLKHNVVLYLCSTSNHNILPIRLPKVLLSYISVLHQTTTAYKHIIIGFVLSYISVLHQTTTACTFITLAIMLSYISVLHQTTTYY